MSASEQDTNASAEPNESGGFQYAYEQIIAEEKDREDPAEHYQADMAQLGEDDEEDPQGFLDPSHPLMERVQKALSQQLQKENERLTLQIRDKDEAVSRIKRHRETVGVELYSMQQQLAKLQIALERAHEKCSNAVQVRMQSEADLQDISGLYEQKQQQRVDIMKRREEAQLELDKFNATLRQIELYNIELKSDILVTRRAAYGTEEQLQSKEKEKRMQDFHIERLNEQLKTVTEDLELYTQQLEAQRQATVAAQSMLKQAMSEMDEINVEKKEYLQKWRASLTGMARRDAALQAAEAAVEQQKEKIRSLEMEVTGLKSSAKKEQETNEKLTAILQRVEAETQFLQSQLAAVAEQRKVLNEQYLMLRSALEQSDRDLTTVKNEQRQLQNTVDQLSKRKEAAVRRKQELEESIMENMGDQTTLEKSAQNVVKATQKLQQQVREKEVSIGEVRNELARIQVDSLNTEAHNKELKQTVEEFEKELSEKDTLIEKYEQEIRQRHDQIEKKQIYILRLNKKYDTLTAHKEEVNTGPLEATINHLTKEISSKEKECSELQRQWIRAQTELVGLMSEIAQREDNVAELKAKTTVMDQKKARIESQFRQAKADIKELESGVRAMHNGFGKVNELIAKNVALQEDLAKTTYNMETEFVEKLKELEQLSTQNQQRIEGLRGEKDRLYEDIIEAERQIMLWEKKIQLERETQAALDPEVGQNEIKAMKKEIHRMELRLGQLKREQERMVQEMELCISKQETIKSSYGANKSQEREHLSQATLKKKINDLKSSIKQSLTEAKRADFDVMRHEEEAKYLQQQLEQIQQQYGFVEDKKLELSRRTQQALFEKRLNLERTLLAQKRAQRYADFTAGKYKIAESLDEVTSKLTKQRRKTQKIKAVLSRLADENPKYAEWFTKLSTFA